MLTEGKIVMRTVYKLTHKPDSRIELTTAELNENIAYAEDMGFVLDKDNYGQVTHFDGVACEFFFTYS